MAFFRFFSEMIKRRFLNLTFKKPKAKIVRRVAFRRGMFGTESRLYFQPLFSSAAPAPKGATTNHLHFIAVFSIFKK
ncbi:MAG: hypothetical protein ACREOI_13030 [bacterium]